MPRAKASLAKLVLKLDGRRSIVADGSSLTRRRVAPRCLWGHSFAQGPHVLSDERSSRNSREIGYG